LRNLYQIEKERDIITTCVKFSSWFQGCALEAPACHGRLTFAFGQLEKLTFFI